MEYSLKALTILVVVILAAYAEVRWVIKGMRLLDFTPPGEGQDTSEGTQSREENGKPYNSGDPRAGQ